MTRISRDIALLLAVFGALFIGTLAMARSTPIDHGGHWCAWAPQNPEVCESRRFCRISPRHPRCAIYCHVNPRDVVCGDVYQPTLAPTAPWVDDSPYPWARSGGGFCEQNPFNIACQNDDFLNEEY